MHYLGYVKELMAELFTVFIAGKKTNSPTPGFFCSDFKRLNNWTRCTFQL